MTHSSETLSLQLCLLVLCLQEEMSLSERGREGVSTERQAGRQTETQRARERERERETE